MESGARSGGPGPGVWAEGLGRRPKPEAHALSRPALRAVCMGHSFPQVGFAEPWGNNWLVGFPAGYIFRDVSFPVLSKFPEGVS